MANLSGKFFGIDMTSPFILGSGPLSYNAEGLLAAFDAGAGGVTTKTLRLKKAHNPIPHIALPTSPNLRGSLLNTEKWSDITWEQWVDEEFPKLVGHPGVLIASIGHTAPEAELITGPVVGTGVVDVIECVAYTRETLLPVIRAVRERTSLPILAKLTFNWGDDLYRAAEEAVEAGVNGFSAIDSIGPALAIDIETRQPILGGIKNQAWVSGAAIRPIAQAVVAELTRRFGLPVIGTGGVIQAEDAIEMSMVGAAAVGVCTAPIIRGLDWFNKTNDKLGE
jgi:dihydroorotate dehydrogenase (fumarate)